MLIQEKLSKDRRQYLMVKKQINVIFDKRLSLEGQYNQLMNQDAMNENKPKGGKAAKGATDFLTFEEL